MIIVSQYFHVFLYFLVQVYPNGACDIFHAGLTVPNAPAFSAKTAAECWSLCQSYAPYCLQSEFTPGLSGGVCTLGDALATNYISSVCLVLNVTHSLPRLILETVCLV